MAGKTETQHFNVIAVETGGVLSDSLANYVQRLLEEGFVPVLQIAGTTWFRRHNPVLDETEAQQQAERAAVALAQQNLKVMEYFVNLMEIANERQKTHDAAAG